MSEAYEQYLASDEWRGVSARRRKADGYKCVCCGATEWLNVHHLYYPSNVYDTTEDQLVTLCKNCHTLVHRIQETYDKVKHSRDFELSDGGSVKYGAALDVLRRHSTRWIVVELWRMNKFSLDAVREYVNAIENVYNKSGRGTFSLSIQDAMDTLAIVKDCWMTNQNPAFNTGRRKAKRISKTKYK